MTCVFDCVHPIWRGGGVCVEATRCECDAGFANQDAMGQPSCVPKGALLSGYIALTVAAAGSSVFLLWHVLNHMRLPLATKTSHRGLLRHHLTLSSAVFTVGCSLVFSVAAYFGGNKPLWGGGIGEIFLTVFHPFRAFATMMVAALW